VAAWRSGILLGFYTAAWAYIEALVFGAATAETGLHPHLAAGLLGLAGLAASGLGLLALSTAPRRLSLILAPAPMIGLAAALTGEPTGLALVYPPLALAAALAGAAALGSVLDVTPAWRWRMATVHLKASASLTRTLILSGLLLTGASEALAATVVAGALLGYTASRRGPLPLRAIESLSRALDSLVGEAKRPGRDWILAYATVALAGIGPAAAIRFHLTPTLYTVGHALRLEALTLYSLLYALGVAAAAAKPSVAGTALVGLIVHTYASRLEWLAAYALSGLLLGYAETSLVLVAVEKCDPLRAPRIAGMALLTASAGVLIYSILQALAGME
jgi:hypothetical protein